MIIMKAYISVLKVFNILTPEKRFLHISQKCDSSDTDILLYCYHFGLVLEVVKSTQQPSGMYVSFPIIAFILVNGVQK